MKRQCIWRCKF
ncbi:hypothetical protein O1D29_003548 [Vibrio cholerae]|nr:hypothetical protein [Vibrio cholerae]EGR0311287.1 hypothetical protein [Vibrio cholerae]EGR5123670.1 hypothetical protein [Vibrio cholerae]EJM7234034.1 hypothetical protein [Vibrio cholerae]EKF9854031.1 hypothetical protein [Vibrio cholerae]